MDNRKVQFLIKVQHEIDKLEKSGEDPKNLEKLKATFYDLAGIKDIVNSSGIIKTTLSTQETVPSVSTSEPNNSSSMQNINTEQTKDKFSIVANQRIGGNIFQTELSGKMVNIYNSYYYELGDKILIEKKIPKKSSGHEYYRTYLDKNNPPVKKLSTKYINYRNIATFLRKYNENLFLKSTTHLVDSNDLQAINKLLGLDKYSFSEHLKKIQSEFIKLTKEHRVSKSIFRKMEAYLFGNDAWSSDGIKMNWAHVDIKDWAKQNTTSPPNPEILDLKIQPFTFSKIKLNTDVSLSNFNDLVLHFKNEITIRQENSLKSLCKLWNFSSFKNDAVDIDVSHMASNIRFYTDVEKLKQAYGKIIRMCLDQELEGEQRHKIILDLKEVNVDGGTEIHFIIHHLNSVFGTTVLDLEERYGQKFTGIINSQINGLCNWSLTANFGDGNYAQIMLWPKGNHKKVDKFDGVEYKLIFAR